MALAAITLPLLICQDEPTVPAVPPVEAATPLEDQPVGPAPPGPGGLAISGDTILVGGRPTYLWSAELPYYRLARQEWPDRLRKVAAAGIRFVTAYVPWNLHEYRDGAFDFTGSTGDARRDLVGFIEAVRRAGMDVILKPGPFICAEVQHGGIPDWLTRSHPGLLARDWRGRTVGFRQDGKPLPDFLDPAYLAYVRRWYQALCAKVLSRLQYPRGPVVALQVENEIPYSTSGLSDPFSWGYTASVEELFRQWLSWTYGDIEVFNRQHGLAVPAYAAVEPPRRNGRPPAPAGWLLLEDWLRFKGWYGGEVLRVYGSILDSLGVTVPLYHNAGMLEDEPPMSFGDAAGRMWLGVTYWLSPHPAASFDSYIEGLRRLKQLKGSQPARPPFAAEMNWGWGTTEEYDFLARYTLPFSRGTNIYTVADGDDAGTLNGRRYSTAREPYPGQAPIDASGGLRPAWEAVRRLASFTASQGERFATAEAPAGVTLGYYPPDNFRALFGRHAGEPFLRQRYPVAKTANDFLQAAMRALVEGDEDYDLVDLQWATAADLARRSCIVAFSQEAMDGETQRKLAAWVRQGGTLILFPSIPTVDLENRPSTGLRDQLLPGTELTPADDRPRGAGLSFTGYPRQLNADPLLHTVLRVGPGATVIGTTDSGAAVAVEQAAGQGRIVYLGAWIDDPAFLRWLLGSQGAAARLAWSDDPAVEVVPLVSADGQETWLFAINRGSATRSVTIHRAAGIGAAAGTAPEREPDPIETSVAGGGCSIIAVQGRTLASVSLESDPGASARMGTWLFEAPRASRLDVLSDGASALEVAADRATPISLTLPARPPRQRVRVTDAGGAAIPFELDGQTLSFDWAPGPGGCEPYRVEYPERPRR